MIGTMPATLSPKEPDVCFMTKFYAEGFDSGDYGHQIGDYLYVACASIEIQIIPYPF